LKYCEISFNYQVNPGVEKPGLHSFITSKTKITFKERKMRTNVCLLFCSLNNDNLIREFQIKLQKHSIIFK